MKGQRPVGSLACALVVVSLLTLQGSASARTGGSWPQYHGDAAHTGVNPAERTLTKLSVGALDEQWTRPLGQPAVGQPVAAEGYVYATTSNGITAIRSRDGAVAWSWAFPRPTAEVGTPAILNHTLYVTAYAIHGPRKPCRGRLYAVNTETGTMLWDRRAVCGASGTAVSGNRVFVTGFATVSAFSAGRGGHVWTTHTAHSFSQAPAVADGHVIASFTNGFVASFDAATGARQWKTHIGNTNDAPTVSAGRVFVGTARGHFFALDEDAGDVVWQLDIHARAGVGSQAVADGILVITTFGGRVLALDAASGSPLWSRGHQRSDATCCVSPAIAHGVVYSFLIESGDPTFSAMKLRTGRVLWGTPMTAKAPAVSDGMVFVLSSDEPPSEDTHSLHAFGLPGSG